MGGDPATFGSPEDEVVLQLIVKQARRCSKNSKKELFPVGKELLKNFVTAILIF